MIALKKCLHFYLHNTSLVGRARTTRKETSREHTRFSGFRRLSSLCQLPQPEHTHVLRVTSNLAISHLNWLKSNGTLLPLPALYLFGLPTNSRGFGS